YRLGHVRDRFEYNAGLDLPAVEDRVAPSGAVGRIVHEPVGVVAAIVPWNAPMALTLSKILPALLTGCTVILKPPRETPLYAYPPAEAFAEAGLPAGVFNVVVSDREAAELLVAHRDVDHVSFTGSSDTGKRIGALASQRVKTVGLELGGKSPVILLDDVDLDSAAPAVLGGGRPAGLDRGWYVEPTLIVGADNSMRSSREEIFGPVVSVIPYDDEADAVRIANDSDFGLSAGVFSADVARGVDIAGRIRSGTVGVNNLGFNMAFPFGGYKESGIGRQHGPESLHEYLETKTIGLPPGFGGFQADEGATR